MNTVDGEEAAGHEEENEKEEKRESLSSMWPHTPLGTGPVDEETPLLQRRPSSSPTSSSSSPRRESQSISSSASASLSSSTTANTDEALSVFQILYRVLF